MDFLKSFTHPDEIVALVRFKLGACESVVPKCNFKAMSPTLAMCYTYLKKTSRSFAAVIQALDGDIRNAVCIFYLVLRALDTVEDDMTIPNDIKIPMLESFYKNLTDPDWKFLKSNEKDKIVLEDFPTISYEFRQLDECYRTVIADICMKMGKGMTVFLDRDIETLDEWDQYCHYVAGLVGIGLSQLFAASSLEDDIVGKDTALANRMGLFLQKTNIIRDYLEDVRDGREFWPKEVWNKHAKELRNFVDPGMQKQAVFCLNELITNALELVPDCIKYMSRLHNQSVFNFCAIPQVMAIATLERCYNNPQVFTGVVKIRKGEAVRMMLESTSLARVKSIMHHFTSEIMKRIPGDDPVSPETRRRCQLALELSATKQEFHSSSVFLPIYVSCAMMLSAIAYNYWSQVEVWYRSYYESE